ncbi:helix-turn-helix transcriptional regulator [Streptomyces sp. NBC_00038]|uniref:helix-turn-helix domain-containing protein n=1 Tax=Streptomyces sp. NBC_00038 TaxID=2903615 RepID=UPI00224E621E|nr:helix-turn-helix transcriptional regulator [Streptomyces sp. NBC_00038]MCX5559687.1 helix-turn-helix domain-containing protein [Streptomyces sp. NBC_00038]
MAGDVAGDEFSELLGQLKQRSGLSYGVLGKRLHMSASTLHRYVNGDAVPTDYAPVERFARVCKATPDELVELHRRWVLADARRGQKGASAVAAPVAVAGSGAGVEPESEAVPEIERGVVPDAPVVRRRRTAVLAGAAVAAAVVSVALVVNLVPGKGDDDQGKKQSVGVAASESVADSPSGADTGDSQGSKGKSASPSASRSGSPTGPAVSASASGGAAAQNGGSMDGATAPAVATNPYKWDGPCSQHYLVNRKAERVPPPPSESEARGWVTALGGVAAGEQMVALTVQGTGEATVVLDALHVRVVTKSAPLAWNDFAMGIGCGGGVETKSFVVDLDAGSPAVAAKAGQRDFPYKVSESDPEVFYVFADSKAHDVSWYLELDWSSGTEKGTVRIDDNGNPFRTSGNVGRPAYAYPLGDSEWWRDEYEPNIKG